MGEDTLTKGPASLMGPTPPPWANANEDTPWFIRMTSSPNQAASLATGYCQTVTKPYTTFSSDSCEFNAACQPVCQELYVGPVKEAQSPPLF